MPKGRSERNATILQALELGIWSFFGAYCLLVGASGFDIPYGRVPLFPFFLPPRDQLVRQAEVVQYSSDHRIGDLLHRLRPGVEGRISR